MTNSYAAGATTVAKLIFTGLCNIHLYDTIVTPRETCKKKFLKPQMRRLWLGWTQSHKKMAL